MVQDLHPNGRAKDHQANSTDQPHPAANHRTAGGQVFPVHGKQQDREVTAGSNRERQANHERNVLAFKQNAKTNRQHAQDHSSDLRDADFILVVGFAFLDHAGIQVMGHRRSTRQGQTCNHRQDGGKGHCRDKAQEDTAADRIGQMHCRHVITAQQGTGSILERRIGAHQQDRAKTDNERQDIEVANKAGRVEHTLTGFFCITYGEEAHQDVRQTRSTEHQRQPEGECRNRILHQTTGAHDGLALWVDLDGFGKQRVEVEVNVLHHHYGHERSARQQQNRLDDLYPGGRQHAAEQHVQAHQNAHQNHCNVVVQTEQKLNQLARPHHLRNQIKRHHYQRAAGRQRANLGLAQSIGRHIGKGVFAQVTQTLCDQKQNDWPAYKEADRVDQAVVARGVHQRGNTQKRRGRHVVARNSQAILKTGDFAARSVIVRCRFIAL